MRRFWRIQNPSYRGAVVGLICALVCCVFNDLDAMRGAENWALDNCFVLRGKRQSSAEVVVVGIDEDSLRKLKKPLTFISPELGEVIRYLDSEGASAIGLDFFIPSDAEDRDYFKPGADGDADQLGIVIAQSKKVVLPEWQLGTEWLSPLFQWKAKHEIDPAWTDLGFVNLTTDNDTFLRRQKLRAKNSVNEAKPQFAFAVFGLAEKKGEEWFTAKSLMLDDKQVPLESDRMLINFVGPPGTIKTVPFHSVLEAARGNPDTFRESWKNKIVFVGVTAYSYQDRHATAYSNQAAMWAVKYLTSSPKLDRMAGTEIQANIVATLKDRAFLIQPLGSWTTPFALLLIGPLLGVGFARLSLGWGALLTILHHWLWKAFCIGVFSWLNWRVEMMSMLLLGVMLYGVTFGLRWRWIRRMMGMVKSEAVARALEADPSKLDLRGEEREISVLFCDVRNFTTYSENHTAHQVVKLLNAYFGVIVPIIEEEGGIVNSYIGDGLMVIFGAPERQSDHALRASRAAVRLVKAVYGLSQRWQELDCPEFRIGVGVHTGKVIVGTIGSKNRLDYTAIGDTVNTASRLESATKDAQSDILLSETTVAGIPEQDRASLADSWIPVGLRLKGKAEKLQGYPIRLWTTSSVPASGPNDKFNKSIEI